MVALPEGSKVTELYGERKTVFKPPVIIEKRIKRKYWFDKVEWWIEWEYCTQGPYKKYKDAHEMWSMAIGAYKNV